MAKIAKKTFKFDVDALFDSIGFNVYAVPEGEVIVTQDSPHVFVPIVENKLTDYSVVFPDQLTITEGAYTIGVAPVDAEGNEPDAMEASYFFDFTPPRTKILNLRME